MHVGPRMFGLGVKWKIKEEASPDEYNDLYLVMPKKKEFKTEEAAKRAFEKAKLDPAIYQVYEFSRMYF